MNSLQGGNLSRVKVSNLVAIRKMIYHYGPITRSEIAKQLELTLPTITTNINAMLEEGMLREIVPLQSDEKSMGRPANLIDYAVDSAYFIGVEMRGSRRQLCLTDIRGSVLYEASSETPYSDYNSAINSACELILDAIHAEIVPENKIKGIGFCTPGIVDQEKGLLIVHPGYNWIDKNLTADLVRLANWKQFIVVENNARARANGALMFDNKDAQCYGSFAYMLISTGIACPFILNNGIVNFQALGAGEVGHMVVDPLGPKCQCGNHGCLEAVSSDTAICEACFSAVSAGNAPILFSLCHGEMPTMEQILQAQQSGESAVINIVHRALYYIGLAIANIYNFIRPDLLIIEGKLFADILNRQDMLKVVNDNLYSTIKDANFRFIAPRKNGGAIGAAATAIRHYLENIDI